MSSFKRIEAKYPLQGLADLPESYGNLKLFHNGTNFHTVLIQMLYFANSNVMVLGNFFVHNVTFFLQCVPYVCYYLFKMHHP